LQSGPLVSPAFVQRGDPFSRFSITYPVIGDPPSFTGGVHLRSTWSLSQSVASGAPGASGSSEMRQGIQSKSRRTLCTIRRGHQASGEEV